MWTCYGQHRYTRIYIMICILFSFYFILISSFLFTFIKGTWIGFSLTWMFHSSGPYPVTSSTAPTHTSFSVLYRRGFTSEGGNTIGCILKAGLHLGPDCGLGAICPVSMETTYQLENQAPRRKSPRALHHLKEYPNYLCNWIESYILLCLLGYDHKPIDNCPLLAT